MSLGMAVIVAGVVVAVIALCVLAVCIRANEKPVTIAPDYSDLGVPMPQRRVQLAAPEPPPTRTWHCTVLHKVDGQWKRLGVSEFVWAAWTSDEVQAELNRRIDARQPEGQYRVAVTRAMQTAA